MPLQSDPYFQQQFAGHLETGKAGKTFRTSGPEFDGPAKLSSPRAEGDGLQSLRENTALSPEGTSDSSPGRSPGSETRHRAVPQGRLKTRLRCSPSLTGLPSLIVITQVVQEHSHADA